MSRRHSPSRCRPSGRGTRPSRTPVGLPGLERAPGPKELTKPSGNSPLTGSGWTQAQGALAGRAWAQGFLRMVEESSQSDSGSPRWAGLPPHTQPPGPEPRAPQGLPAPGQGLGSQQRTTSRAAPPPARAPAIKTFRRAPSPLPRRPFPPLLAVSSLRAPRATPPSGPARPLGVQKPISRFTSGTVTQVTPGARSAPLGSSGPGALGPAPATHCHPQSVWPMNMGGGDTTANSRLRGRD